MDMETKERPFFCVYCVNKEVCKGDCAAYDRLKDIWKDEARKKANEPDYNASCGGF